MFKVIQKRTGRIRGYYNPKGNKTEHKNEILLFVLFVCGILIGAVAIRTCSGNLPQRLQMLFQNYLEVKAGQGIGFNFCNALFRELLLLLAVYCVGLCAVGTPGICCIALAYGGGIGLVGAYLYKKYMLKGIGYCALLFYPGRILFIAALILSGSCGVQMSRTILNTLIQKETAQEPNFRSYNVQFLKSVCISVASALLESALFSLFMRYFQLS